MGRGIAGESSESKESQEKYPYDLDGDQDVDILLEAGHVYNVILIDMSSLRRPLGRFRSRFLYARCFDCRIGWYIMRDVYQKEAFEKGMKLYFENGVTLEYFEGCVFLESAIFREKTGGS